MTVEFRLPDIGEGLTEAEIVRWLVAVGDHVREDEPFVEIETAKAVVEMPAPATGTVARLGGDEGAIIAVGDILVVIDDAPPTAGAPGASADPERPDGYAAAPSTTTGAGAPADGEGRDAANAPGAPGQRVTASAGGRPLATPATRGLARRLGVDLAAVTGTGPGGRITDDDVGAAAGAPADAATRREAEPGPVPDRQVAARPREQAAAGSRIPLRGVRRRTAETMTEAWRSVPHVDSFHEIDVTDVFAIREQLKAVAAERGVALTVTAFFVRATALALVEHPLLNASLDVEAGEIVVHDRRDVAVAVDTPDGLVLPVVRRADERSILDIASELERLGEAARARRLTPAELSASTFTISNHGVFGGWFGTSLVHGAEVGIAGFGPAMRRPVFDEHDRIVARRILVMNVAADHRVVDGREIIAFSLAVRRRLEAPATLLVEGA